MSAAVEVEHLSFAYAEGGRPAVADVSLTLAPGEVLAVVGPSGSGKSSLLRLVAGLLRPSAGAVLIGGVDMAQVSPERRPVGMVFQGYALFPHLSVAANIGFGLAVRKTRRQDRERLVDEVAARLGLSALLDRRPDELSGGERQRVALARALLRDPVVFCLDEPLSALDPVLRTAARRDLDTVLRADDRCALHVTHDQVEAMTLGDRVAVLREGRLEQVGTPREIYERPASTFVASFVGSHPMSLLSPAAARVRAAPEVATVGVRAEHVAVTAGEDALVVGVDDLGHEQVATLDLDGTVLRARLPDPTSVRRGDRVGFTVLAHTGFDAEGSRLP
ncbi:MAG TPA: ABC transporter ATP-binding protein [Mycobacteriales bacterium]|nr:ABC transporter ATP-binding protein [Mycobacteriales bacterium]